MPRGMPPRGGADVPGLSRGARRGCPATAPRGALHTYASGFAGAALR